MEASDRQPSLKVQSAWLLFAKVVGFVFSFVLPLLVVRFLAQESVGEYRQIFQVVQNAAAILPLGVGMSAFYYLSREPERRGATIFNILIFNTIVGILAVIVLTLFPKLIGGLFHSEEITRLAPLIGLVICFWIAGSFLELVAVANQEPRFATAFIILAQFTKSALMIGAVMVFSTVESIVYAALAQSIIQTAVMLFYLRSRFPGFWRSFDLGFLREQLIYAIPYGFAGLLWTAQSDIQYYFVGYHFNSADYAVYAYGCFQFPLVTMLSESVSSVLIPRMSALQAAGDKREMIRLSARAMQKLSFFFLPIYLFLLITAQTFIVTLFTRNYERAVPIFSINLTVMLIYIWISDPIARAFRELGRYMLVWRSFVVVGLVAALYYGSRNFSLPGIIGIVVVIAFVEKFGSEIMIVRRLGVRLSDASQLSGILKTAACAIAAGIPTWLFHSFVAPTIAQAAGEFARGTLGLAKTSIVDFFSGAVVLGLCFIVFAAVYLLTASLAGVIEEEEKKSILAIVVKFRRAAGKLFGQNLETQI